MSLIPGCATLDGEGGERKEANGGDRSLVNVEADARMAEYEDKDGNRKFQINLVERMGIRNILCAQLELQLTRFDRLYRRPFPPQGCRPGGRRGVQ